MINYTSTSFCHNGHLVEKVSAGSNKKMKSNCSSCGSSMIAVVFNWKDSNFPEGKLVPPYPKGKESIFPNMVNSIDVYDISSIPLRKWHDRETKA